MLAPMGWYIELAIPPIVVEAMRRGYADPVPMIVKESPRVAVATNQRIMHIARSTKGLFTLSPILPMKRLEIEDVPR